MRLWVGGAVSAAVLVLAGCDAGPKAPAKTSAVATGAEHAAAATGEASDAAATTTERADSGYRGTYDGPDHRDDPVPQVDGKPMWSASRRYGAEDNARRNFTRNGSDFGAGSVTEFVSKAHDFVADPPSGTETLSRRNGDRLLYNAKSNTFAVVNREGAPRTMFKPDNGQAYWAEQKQREAERRAGGGGGRRDAGERGDSAG